VFIARRCAAARRADKLAAARPAPAEGGPSCPGVNDTGTSVETANPFSRHDLGARAASMRAAGASARAQSSDRGAAAAPAAARASASLDDGDGTFYSTGEVDALPAGWSAVWSDHDDCFYYEHESGESTWSRPD
jgi:hypothetical protein